MSGGKDNTIQVKAATEHSFAPDAPARNANKLLSLDWLGPFVIVPQLETGLPSVSDRSECAGLDLPTDRRA